MLPRMVRGKLSKESVKSVSLGMSHSAVVTSTGGCYMGRWMVWEIGSRLQTIMYTRRKKLLDWTTCLLFKYLVVAIIWR